eukprot:gb/GEZN01007100.1/.p1 GENE.gb/GEZN01007100.1/~~gb/GEZN01007100.1/.p1  ORF type:complete len:497 (-),score=48.95 gb/GEZN01007100.1/:62-1552(-)
MSRWGQDGNDEDLKSPLLPKPYDEFDCVHDFEFEDENNSKCTHCGKCVPVSATVARLVMAPLDEIQPSRRFEEDGSVSIQGVCRHAYTPTSPSASKCLHCGKIVSVSAKVAALLLSPRSVKHFRRCPPIHGASGVRPTDTPNTFTTWTPYGSPADGSDLQPDRIFTENVITERENCMAILFSNILFVLGVLLMILPPVWLFRIKILKQYERGIIFRLGRVQREAKGPGFFLLLPFIHSLHRVDLRVNTIAVESQELITKDSVTVRVSGVVFFYVEDPFKSVLCATRFQHTTLRLAQTTLRCVCGESELDELLHRRGKVNARLTYLLNQGTSAWGVKVTNVEVKDVLVPQKLQRAMAAQAEAERIRRAKLIHAEGELQASMSLLAAANRLKQNQGALQLRYISTVKRMCQLNPSTIVYPIPLSLSSHSHECFSQQPTQTKKPNENDKADFAAQANPQTSNQTYSVHHRTVPPWGEPQHLTSLPDTSDISDDQIIFSA